MGSFIIFLFDKIPYSRYILVMKPKFKIWFENKNFLPEEVVQVLSIGLRQIVKQRVDDVATTFRRRRRAAKIRFKTIQTL